MTYPRVVRTGLAVAAAIALVSCGGGGGGDDPAPEPPVQEEPAPGSVAAAKCAELNGAQIAAIDIALGTRGAAVTSTELIPPSGEGASALGEYCKVIGSIAPIDPSGFPITFQLNLPTEWNGKALMQGGGGYNGSIPNTTVGYASSAIDQPSALGRGYATFSSDSGHTGVNSQDGRFGQNDEALINFAADALKKTRDAAMQLIVRRYERAPDRSYFVGGSTGGREALAVVQRWPQDFDGAISIFPAWNAATLDLFFGHVTRALAAGGGAGYLTPDKQKLVYDRTIAACDDLDGADDGLISNVAACEREFGIDDLPVCGENQAPETHVCLSAAQIASLAAYSQPVTFNYPLASGETGYPGFPVLSGADMRGPLGLNQAPPTNPSDQPMQPGDPASQQPYFSVFWEQFVKYFVTRDPGFNYLSLNPLNPPALQRNRISALTGIMDINDPDLTAFNAKGGKLLMVHGLSDALVSHRATIDYYDRVVATMGEQTVDNFVRFYTVPGYGHVFGAFMLSWDSLTALENWVEQGVAPTGQVAMDANAATFGRTRPLCEYPTYPQYNGAGALDLAASYTCTTDTPPEPEPEPADPPV